MSTPDPTREVHEALKRRAALMERGTKLRYEEHRAPRPDAARAFAEDLAALMVRHGVGSIGHYHGGTVAIWDKDGKLLAYTEEIVA